MLKWISDNSKLVLVLIPLLSLGMHWKFFSLDLMGPHVWRQTQTQTVINNFATEDFNILNPKFNKNPDTGRIVRMEFPVMQWVFALFFKLFGPHIIISRILTFVMGIFSVFGIYFLLKTIFHKKIPALIGAWAFNFSPVFFYYTIAPLPDNFALCCSIWAAVFFWQWVTGKQWSRLVVGSIFLCLAALVKLPFVLYASIPVGFIFMAYVRREKQDIKQVSIAVLALVLALMPIIAWYAWVIPTWGENGIVKGIADSKLSIMQTLDILQGVFISVLPELLLNYGSVLFFVLSFYFIYRNKSFKDRYFPVFVIWSVAILLYFFFELNMISTKHDYYLFPFLPLLFILVSYGAYQLVLSEYAYGSYLVLLLLLILPVTAYLRIAHRFNPDSPGFNPVYYYSKEELRALSGKNEYCVVGNDESHFIILYYLDRKGWAFENDKLSDERLKELIAKGAKYLYTDSRVDTIPGIKSQLKDKLFEENNLRVYALQGN